MSEIKELRQAWEEDSEEADAYLARYYAGKEKDDEIRALTEDQFQRLLELYCGPKDALEDLRWLKKAAELKNPHAQKFLAGLAKESPEAEKKHPEEKKKPEKKKKKGGLIPAILLFLLAAGLCGGYAYYRYTTDTVEIDPVPYMSWQVKGLDGFGTASASIDAPAMTNDSGRIVDGEVISLYISKDQGLSNGDEVTLEIAVNEENAKKHHVAFTRKETTFVVEGLQEIETVDVFDEIEVSFSGENGKGTASVVSTSSDPFLKEVTYVCEPSENLSNGDVILVRAVLPPNLIETYGKTAAEFEREATVVSLSRYPYRMDEFSDAAYGRLYDEAVSSLRAVIFKDSARYSKAADPEGNRPLADMREINVWPSAIYVVSPKNSDGQNAQFRNRIILVMHVQSSDSGASMREFYCPVIFENVLINDEEVLSMDDLSVKSEVWLHGKQTAKEVYDDVVSGYGGIFSVMGKTLE